VAITPPDAAVAAAVPVAPPPPPPRPATVVVHIRPWCDITIDGTPRGRSPNAAAISLEPGRHTLRCEQPGLGHAITRELDLDPGERLEVTGDVLPPVPVRIDVRDAIPVVDGEPRVAGATIRLAPGRHRVELRRGTTILAADYVQVTTKPCTIRDAPELACYED
jgi:hypothetical protein